MLFWLIGLALGASGTGPGGYDWVDCNEPGGPACTYATSAQVDPFIGLCSEEVRTIGIGFSFPFYGANYAVAYVSANGVVHLSGQPSCPSSTVLCSDAAHAPLTGTEGGAFLAPWWLDWAMDNDDPTGAICGTSGCSDSGPFGAAQSFRSAQGFDGTHLFLDVEWFDTAAHRPVCTEPDTATFGMRLYDDGRIRFSWLDTSVGQVAVDDGASGTVGISSGANGEYTQVSFDAPFVPALPYVIEFSPPCPLDADGDGACVTVDCDDGDPTVFPGAVESCNGVDDDCDGVVPADELDGDGDGLAACEGDCDDGDGAVGPGAAEVCGNGVDDDCDPATVDLFDGDGDGSDCAADCDDADPAVAPGLAEVCDNGVDDDCDPATADVEDGDGDGWSCSEDCDDGDPAVSPDATELCGNGVDDDCSPLTLDLYDEDGDGSDCATDCDDSDEYRFPGATDVPGNGVDEDCDGADAVAPGTGTGTGSATGSATGTATGGTATGAGTGAATGGGTGGLPYGVGDVSDDPEKDAGGCTCAHGGAGGGWVLGLLGLLGLRRRVGAADR